jgi:hypothetical protein
VRTTHRISEATDGEDDEREQAAERSINAPLRGPDEDPRARRRAGARERVRAHRFAALGLDEPPPFVRFPDMLGPRTRAAERALARGADRLDDVGGHAVAALWSLLVRCLHLLARALVIITAVCGIGVARARAAHPRLWRLGSLAAALAVGLAVASGPSWCSGRPVSESSDVEALARVIRSEIGIGKPHERLHVAWATRNLANQRGQSIAEMACSPCGAQNARRPVATGQNAQPADRELARHVLSAPTFLDPTVGATNFINPRLQDRLAESGALPGYAGRTYERVSRRWRERYGLTLYYRLAPTLEFWGPPP